MAKKFNPDDVERWVTVKGIGNRFPFGWRHGTAK